MTAIPPLRSKRQFTHTEVQRVWEHIEEIVPGGEAARLVEEAAEEVLRCCSGRRTAMCWSGGKDSLALQAVVETAGLPTDGVCGVAQGLEFPEQLAWVERHAPPGVVVMDRSDFDLPWLAANPRYVFPSGPDAQVFTQNVTRWSQRQYQAQHDPDVMLMGRRRADGNWFDNRAPFCASTNGAGMLSYSPIRDWTHEQTLGVVRWYSVAGLPPVYGYPHGWTTGTGPWPGRRMPGDPWYNTILADPSVVAAAARYGVPGAAQALADAEGVTA